MAIAADTTFSPEVVPTPTASPSASGEPHSTPDTEDHHQ